MIDKRPQKLIAMLANIQMDDMSSNEEGSKETNEGADMDFVCKSDSSDSYFYKRQIVLISFIYLINPLNY